MCAKVFSRRANVLLWIVAELGAMAADLAKFPGGILGPNLLFGLGAPRKSSG